ncbi:MAG TPA: hypothetical protein VFM14_06145 [Gemmatimonadales bacterium]|nr:hypothetical protein [Gemmatimonadales bacterium]
MTLDLRPRHLLEKYTALVGALLMEHGDALLEFEVPAGERTLWGADSVKIALTPEALDEDPDAELLALGSLVFERLVAAIRSRGVREQRGYLRPTIDPSPGEIELPARLDGADAETDSAEITILPIGRLLARVAIQAGPRLEERLIESEPVDLSTGVSLPLSAVEGDAAPGAAPPAGTREAKARPVGELLPLLFGRLEKQLAEDLGRLRVEAEFALAAELTRLDRYYRAIIQEHEEARGDEEDTGDAVAALEHELERRKEEEQYRYQVRVTVHPLQLVEWRALAQRTTWLLKGDHGHQAAISATRLLSGEGSWILRCPGCGAEPREVRVCRSGHAACDRCSEWCAVCGTVDCGSHGLARCATGGHFTCAEHAKVCDSCGNNHCTDHSARCDERRHNVCPVCAISCARCSAAICKKHGVRTADGAPKGARWLCADCATVCEGGTSEPVGVDEVVRCSSCERNVCRMHQTACAVDNLIHCSRHLRRSDASGRLLCEKHRDTCAEEPDAVLATDEVYACATCGSHVCHRHSATCNEEMVGDRHCHRHMAPLADRGGAPVCEKHRTVCHVDGLYYSLAAAKPCGVCGKAACEKHRMACHWCGRLVCTKDIHQGKCRTCAKLTLTADPADELVQAAVAANDDEPPKAKSWKTSRDASGTVVELELGWTRKLVFAVPHGESAPSTVVQHSAFGTKRVR